MSIFRDITSLFFPRVCVACGDSLPDGAEFICTQCRWDIPLTYFWENPDNPMAESLYGHFPIENASALFYFVHDSKYREAIHKLKYAGGWRIGIEFGKWLGAELHQSELYKDIDVVVPIPLHSIKRLSRGYNQAEYIAKGVAKSMGIEMDSRSVVRKKYNSSQTSLSQSERWENVENIFKVINQKKLSGKHILLIDDVFTTGATAISCARAIVEATQNCKISVATLAVPNSFR